MVHWRLRHATSRKQNAHCSLRMKIKAQNSYHNGVACRAVARSNVVCGWRADHYRRIAVQSNRPNNEKRWALNNSSVPVAAGVAEKGLQFEVVQ